MDLEIRIGVVQAKAGQTNEQWVRLEDALALLRQERTQVQGLIAELKKRAHPATSTWTHQARTAFGICADQLTVIFSGACGSPEAQDK